MTRTSVILCGVLSVACGASNGGDRRPGGSSGAGGQQQASGGTGASPAGAAGDPGAGGTGVAGMPSAGSAGSGGVPAGGTAGTAGMGAEPGSDVHFDWPESVPGLTCKSGHYVGVFNGVWAPSIIVFPAPIPVAGNVDLYLAESMTGEFLEITDGKVSGLANGVFPYSADIEGTLDCKTKKLVNGRLKNGLYTVPGLPPVSWEGPVGADYDLLTSSLTNGTWMGTEMLNALYGGSGTWNAGWVP